MDDSIRASDADRDRVNAQLRDHFAAGRITSGELDERLSAALNAKTFGDLRRIMADLPGPVPALLIPPIGWMLATFVNVILLFWLMTFVAGAFASGRPRRQWHHHGDWQRPRRPSGRHYTWL